MLEEEILRQYLNLPWTIYSEIRFEKGTYFTFWVKELPGFFATGKTEEEAGRNFWEALECHLLSYLAEGEQPPIPELPSYWFVDAFGGKGDFYNA